MKRGGPVKKYAAGGATETNQYGSWGGANATDAVSANPASYTGTPSYTSPTTSTSGPFSTTPGTSPLNQSSPAIPSNYTSALAGYKYGTGNAYGMADSQKWRQNMATPGYSQHQYDPTNLAQWDQLSPGQQAYIGYTNKDYGGVKGQGFLAAAKGGSIPALDDGGEVEDPGGVDMGQGQAGQAGDLSGALDAVQQAYQYGLQQITGNIPTVPAGPGGDQTQGGPQDRGNQLAANIPTVPAGPGGDQPNPNPFPTKTAPIPFGKQAEGADYTAAVARGGSVPSLDAGGVMPPPAAPQPQQPTPAPAGGGVQGNQPPQLMRYLTGADAAPIPHVLRTMQTMQGHGRAARAVASGQTPQQKYAILQALRRLSDNAGTHAKVSLTGNGKIPASLPHAVMFANKKFEYQPTPYHVSFALKGKGKPTNKAARGGAIQAFDDGGDVNSDPTQQLADAGAPITMDVTDLQNGQTQSQDITPDQLQSLTSGTFDSYIGHPEDTLTQALQRASHTSYGPQQGAFGNQGQPRSLEAPQPGPPGEGDISSQAPPAWQNKPENFQESGPQVDVQPGTQGGSTRTFRPQDAEFGVNNQFSGAPVGQVTSRPLAPAVQPEAQPAHYSEEYTVDENGVRHAVETPPSEFDKSTQVEGVGPEAPYSSSGAGTPQTDISDTYAAGAPTGATPNVVRYGIGQAGAAQAANAALSANQAMRMSAAGSGAPGAKPVQNNRAVNARGSRPTRGAAADTRGATNTSPATCLWPRSCWFRHLSGTSRRHRAISWAPKSDGVTNATYALCGH